MNQIDENELLQLVSMANSKLSSLKGEQIIVIKSSKSNVYTFDMDLSGECENGLIDTLHQNNDIEVSCLVCMWRDGGIEIPSMSIRKKLLALSESNESTILILQGDGGFCIKTIKTCMP